MAWITEREDSFIGIVRGAVNEYQIESLYERLADRLDGRFPRDLFLGLLGHAESDVMPWVGISHIEAPRENLRRFLEYVASDMANDGMRYSISLMPARKEDLDIIQDYVSWLVIEAAATEHNPGKLRIVFNNDKISVKLFGAQSVTDLMDWITPPLSVCFRVCLTKILLHEGAHLILHLDRLVEAFKAGGEVQTAATEEEEREAWILAMFLWACIVGDAAIGSRRVEKTDMAWLLA